MVAVEPMTDIHCHLIPEIDDGSDSYETSLAMARMAVEDGIETIITTPHQLGAFRQNTGDLVRQRTDQLQQYLDEHDVPLTVLPGGDVRIEPDMVRGLRRKEVMTLADHGKHVLLELPHELYLPLEPVLGELGQHRMVGILSHPERNRGLLAHPETVTHLVDEGCLMQVTAGSLLGSFGPASQQMSEWMIRNGLTHFLATDAHSATSRRPRMARAHARVAEIAGTEAADHLCCLNPRLVAEGGDVQTGRLVTGQNGMRRGWFGLRKVAS